MELNLNHIVNTWPLAFSDKCDFTIEIDSQENIILESCETKDVDTGILLSCMIPLTHNLSFKGNQFLEHVSAKNKFVLAMGQILKIQVVNYGVNTISIPKNTPLGVLVLTSNK